MKNPIRTALLCAAPVALVAALSACSDKADQEATEQGADQEAAAGEDAAGPATAQNDETAANARALLKKMADYLDSQQAISLSYDSIFEVVSEDHQKFQIATSGTVDMQRPNKIHTTRRSGFSDTEMVFDGTTLSFLGKGQNAYLQTEAPGTIDQLIDQLRDKFHRQLPGADLLQTGVYDALMTDVTDVKDLGSGVIGGTECDHLAFRTKELDWQIWIAQGERPYPCRYVITSKNVDQGPQYSVQVSDWKTGSEVAADDFAFKAPAGAKQVDPKELVDIDELPKQFAPGE